MHCTNNLYLFLTPTNFSLDPYLMRIKLNLGFEVDGVYVGKCLLFGCDGGEIIDSLLTVAIDGEEVLESEFSCSKVNTIDQYFVLLQY